MMTIVFFNSILYSKMIEYNTIQDNTTMDPTIILLIMLVTYAIPIGFVYYKYRSYPATHSISSIITSTEPFLSFIPFYSTSMDTASSFVFQIRHFIALCMLIMAGFTILYEAHRQSHRWSIAAIIVLLGGIFGVIFIPEQNHTHYIFAGAAFFAIIGFMFGHTFCGSGGKSATHDNLRMLLYAQILFMVITVIGVIQETAIFAIEALFLLNFAIFYLYLHFSTIQLSKN